RRDPPQALDEDPALTIVASTDRRVYVRHALDVPVVQGELRVNPLYAVEERGEHLHLRLQFPSPDYEDEYGACRQYLPAEVDLPRRLLEHAQTGRISPDLGDLVRRRVLVDLPRQYY